MIKKEDIASLVSYGMKYIDGEIYFYNYTYGAIFKMDLEGNTDVIWIDNEDSFFSWNMYGGIEYVNEKLIFAPRCADEILIYELKNKTIRKIPYYTKSIVDGMKINQFVSIHRYGDYCYLFPGRNDEILKLDTNTYDIDYIRGWADELGEMPNPQSVKFSNVRIVSEGVCMLPCFQKGKILEFDMKTDTWAVHNICDEPLSDIVFDGKIYWISLRDKAGYVKWDKTTGTIELKTVGNIKEHIYGGYKYIIDGIHFIYLIPIQGNSIVSINKDSEKQSIVYTWENLDCSLNMLKVNSVRNNAYCCERVSPELNMIFDALTGKIIILDAVDCSIQTIELRLNKITENQINKRIMNEISKRIQYENENMSLVDYISYIR